MEYFAANLVFQLFSGLNSANIRPAAMLIAWKPSIRQDWLL